MKADVRAAIDRRVKELVDSSPPLTQRQRDVIVAIMGPAVRERVRAREAEETERLRVERAAERAGDRDLIRRRRARRRDPADIALEVLSSKVKELRAENARRTEVVDPIAAEARRIQGRLGISWSDAFSQARAIGKLRTLDDLRTRESHEQGDHVWCAAHECAVAAEELGPDDVWSHCGHSYAAHGSVCDRAVAS